MSRKRSHASSSSSSSSSSVNLVANIIDTAGEVSMDSAFAQVTAECRRFKKIEPIKPPREYTKTEDDMNKFQSFLNSRVELTKFRNTAAKSTKPRVAASSSSSSASSASSSSSKQNFKEMVEKQEKEKVDRELRAMSTCMQMSDGMNFGTKEYAAPGSEMYKTLLEHARRHSRKLPRWHQYTPKKGEHPIHTKKLKNLHTTLFESVLAHHKFGEACNPEWFIEHLCSESDAIIVGREVFSNHENMLFLSLSFWVVRSLYYKLYVVFLVDTDSAKKQPEHYYIDYLYVRFCQPIDGHL